jgi:carboxypeptidase C (cathepsin A)
MFYIESPADVGFSLCPDKTECKWTDENTADDNSVAILNLLQKFPEIMNNDLYISGESYAGIYVPKAVLRLDAYITKNKGTNWVPNLKGFMVGNGVTNWKYDTTPAFVKMGYWHGLYDDDLYAVLKDCDLSYYEWNADSLSQTCKDAMTRFGDLTA